MARKTAKYKTEFDKVERLYEVIGGLVVLMTVMMTELMTVMMTMMMTVTMMVMMRVGKQC